MRPVTVSSVLLLLLLSKGYGQDDYLFELSIIHINDFHAKFEPVSVRTSVCHSGDNEKGLCYGGLARMVTKISELQNSLPNPVLLNAGDSFQGSLLYSLFKWNVTVELMNRIPFDATALGNHEFDDGVAGLLPYLEALSSPVVASNIDISQEPSLQGKFQPSVVLERGGRKIGIIGCITKYTSEMSSSGDTIFLDEVAPVTAEAARLRAEGVDILILLSHSGYDVDMKMAAKVPDIDIIVGAHSHSFLYTGEPPSVERAAGEYPTVVTQENGRRVLVVQAFCYSKYVGAITLRINSEGEIVSWTGNPQLLDSTVTEDPETAAALAPWVAAARHVGDRPLGTSAVLLRGSNCYNGECSLGSFLTDAMVAEHVDLESKGSWTRAALAILNPGGIRASLGESPNVTFNDLVTSQPFANTIDTIELQGKDLEALLELSASRSPRSYRDFTQGKGCMQVSGMRVSYNMTAPPGSRLTELLVRCAHCRVPELRPVEPEEWYAVAMPSFLSRGGSGYTLIPERGRNKVVGYTDVDVIAKYIAKSSPITQGIDGRIQLVDE